MELYYVNYYNQFHCIGPACENTCCAVWEIEIDDKSYRKYRNYPGEWGQRFEASIDKKKHCFRLKGKECIFLNKDHLCDIQAKLGEEMLCRTCKIFPRHMEEYGERREFMLSLACPEAARMILFKTEPTIFYKRIKERSIPDCDRVDEELLNVLLRLREAMLEILHRNELNYAVRSDMVLALAHDADRAIKQRKWQEAEVRLQRYTKEGAAERFVNKLYNMQRQEPEQARMKKFLHMLEGLELLDGRWKAMLNETQRLLYEEEDNTSYELLLQEFLQKERGYAQICENLLEYFLITYLPGAVYDNQVCSKVKFAVFSTRVMLELYLARYKRNRQQGRAGLEQKDFVELAYWYAREVENSRNNLEALDTVLGAHPEFTLEKMLM